MIVFRADDHTCCCAFSIESFIAGVEQRDRFKSLCSLIGESFSCVLRIASSDFGLFKFAAACADAALDSGSFGTRFQCWTAVAQASSSSVPASAVPADDWVLFRDSVSATLSSLPLSHALRRNHHEHVITGQSLIRVFKPRSSIFVSHSWGDGTGEFIARLKAHLEQQTLANVWVDMDGLNQQQEKLIPSFREALCQARVVVVVLTPSYLTRPNCLRELRWALDFERAGHISVVLMSLHPAVTFEGRLQLVQDGPLRGLVFSSKEKKVKQLCPEAIALVKRLNDVHMNTLPWHELQAWRSDDAKSDWEEQRRYVQGGGAKMVRLAGGADGLVEETVKVVKDWLACAAPRPTSECVQMDDTDVLVAADVASVDAACGVLDLSRYPEASAAAVKLDMEEGMRLRDEEAKKKQEEEERLKAEAKRKKEEEKRLRAEAKKKAEEERLKAEAEAKKKADDEKARAEAEAKRKAEEERLRVEAEQRKKVEEERLAAVAAASASFRRRCLYVTSILFLVALVLLLRRGWLPLRVRRLLALLLRRWRRQS